MFYNLMTHIIICGKMYLVVPEFLFNDFSFIKKVG